MAASAGALNLKPSPLPANPAKPRLHTDRVDRPTGPLEQLEALAVGEAFSAGVALLDFQGPADLATWLTTNI